MKNCTRGLLACSSEEESDLSSLSDNTLGDLASTNLFDSTFGVSLLTSEPAGLDVCAHIFVNYLRWFLVNSLESGEVKAALILSYTLVHCFLFAARCLAFC